MQNGFYLHSRLLCFLLLFCSQILPAFGPLALPRLHGNLHSIHEAHIRKRHAQIFQRFNRTKCSLVFYFEKPHVCCADPQLTLNPPSLLWTEPNLRLSPGFGPAADRSLFVLEVHCDHSLKSLHSHAAFPHRRHLSLSSTS